MQSKFTQQFISVSMIRGLAIIVMLVFITRVSYSQVVFNEGFDTGVPANWTIQNNSNPLGVIGWAQGIPASGGRFDSHTGNLDGYVATDFSAVDIEGTISNWLISPNITIKDGDIFTFYTRALNGIFPDRLQVRMSTNGASTDVGATETSLGDFTTLLLDINPTYSSTVYPEVWTQFTITISGLGGVPASGRIAFRYFVEDGGANGANSFYIGVDDAQYKTFGGPCTGAPTPGNTLSSVPTICAGIPFTLSIENEPGFSGLTHQWQSSPALAGPYSDIPGATQTELTTTEVVATYYRCNETCSFSTTTTSSTPVLVGLSLPTDCYCIPPASSCGFLDEILNVTFGSTLNNSSSGCALDGHSDYSLTVSSTEVVIGGANPMSVTINDGGGEFVTVWIDYDHNGVFDPGEYTMLGKTPGRVVNGIVAIPASALTGDTKMRVRVTFGGPLDPTAACTGIGSGETEDYEVTIIPCVPGVITSQPANASAACGGTASFTTSGSGSLPTYQWEQRVDASSPWTLVSNGGIYSGATTATLTLSDITTVNDGYQYRAIFTSGCTGPDFTTIALLTVTPLKATVTPVSATVCAGTIQPLSITNIISDFTASYSSGMLNTPIPDDDPTGISNSINVSNIPNGAVITGLKIKINVPHSYAGDLVMVLKAPNGSILNLDYYIGATTGPGTTIGFVNTEFSSTATTDLASGTDPWTGSFAPDAVTIPFAGFPGGPVGFDPTVGTFSDLYSIPNGDWTIAIYDGLGQDEGMLVDWSMEINYAIPIFATGVWTPVEGLFTDPAATTPYTGTLLTTVYANPAATTNYSAVITIGSCTSDPTVIPVNISTPVAGLATPEDKSTCPNGNTSFTTTVTGGNPVKYQWQVSTDGGTTFNNIAANGTSATLNLNAVTQNMDGYKYRVIASVDPCGSDTSAAATLDVNVLPDLTISTPGPGLLTPGVTTVVTASNPPAPLTPNSYTWTLNGTPITGVTTGSVTNINIDAIGTYQATVIDANGCESTSNELVIGAQASDRLWIYPNPSTGGQFQVRLYSTGSPNEKRTVYIFNSAGVIITKKDFNVDNISNPYLKMEFNLDKAASGIYLVKVWNHYAKKAVSGFVIVGR